MATNFECPILTCPKKSKSERGMKMHMTMMVNKGEPSHMAYAEAHGEDDEAIDQILAPGKAKKEKKPPAPVSSTNASTEYFAMQEVYSSNGLIVMVDNEENVWIARKVT